MSDHRMKSPPAAPSSGVWQDTALVLGLPVATGLVLTLIRDPSGSLTFSTSRLAQSLGFQLLLGVPLVTYLGARGYRLGQWTPPLARKDFLRAIPVWLYGLLAVAAGGLLAWVLSPSLGRDVVESRYMGRPALWIVAVASAFNAVFEEFIWLGFAVNGPGQRKLGPSLAWSIGPRCLVHLYQGWKGLFLIGPLGLWYFRYYWRSGRLWPVIIAHALQDVIVFSMLARQHAG
jgi:uncharacterized protein